MPLDRRVTVILTATTLDDEGDEQSSTVSLPLWATRTDGDVADTEEEGGSRDETRRDYRIRWRADIAGAFVSEVSVQDGALTFNALRVREETDSGRTRKRWLTIQGVHST